MTTINFKELAERMAQQSIKKPVQQAQPRANGKYQYYCDLCAQRGLKPNPAIMNDWRQLNSEIDRIKALPRFEPITENQRNMVIRKSEEIGMQLPANLDKMSKQSASGYIQQLRDIERSMGETLPVTEWQLERVGEMFWCEEVNFTDLDEIFTSELVETEYGISYKKPLDYEASILWIAEHKNRNEVYDFISKYSKALNNWKRTRISDAYAERINKTIIASGGDPLPMQQLKAFDKKTADQFMSSIMYEPEVMAQLIIVNYADTELPKDDPQYERNLEERLIKEQQDFMTKLLAVMGMSSRTNNIIESTNLLELISEWSAIAVPNFITPQAYLDMLNDTIEDSGLVELILDSIELEMSEEDAEQADKPFK